jgi:hypothetical protein
VSIKADRPLRGRQLWTTRVPGFTAHFVRIHQPSGSLFMSDGWGVTFSSLSFRRRDLADGAELGRIRTGTAVRCLAIGPGGADLIAATDNKLFRLSMDRLQERQRWDRRIPRYSDSIVLRGKLAVVANWIRPRASIIDLETGAVRRRDTFAMTLLIDGPKDPLLVGGSKDGGLASIDPRTGGVTRLLDASPAIDAAVDAIGSGMWATTGIRAIATTGLVGPGVPTHELRFDPFERTQPARRFRLPEAVRNIALGHSEMWLGREGALVALPLPVGAQPAGVWRPPKDHDIAACDPDARIAIVTTRLMDEDAAMMTAFELR